MPLNQSKNNLGVLQKKTTVVDCRAFIKNNGLKFCLKIAFLGPFFSEFFSKNSQESV